ncbi:unnamed protein product, partial [marine sediment metagenome]
GVIIGVVMVVVFVVVGIALGPTVIYYFGFINSTSMAGVELGTILALFAGYAPLFYYLALIGGAITMLMAAVKATK